MISALVFKQKLFQFLLKFGGCLGMEGSWWEEVWRASTTRRESSAAVRATPPPLSTRRCSFRPTGRGWALPGNNCLSNGVTTHTELYSKASSNVLLEGNQCGHGSPGRETLCRVRLVLWASNDIRKTLHFSVFQSNKEISKVFPLMNPKLNQDLETKEIYEALQEHGVKVRYIWPGWT